MIESVIATSHYYYVSFFDSPQIKSISAITKLIADKFEIEPVSTKSKNLFHLQILLEGKAYGAESVLNGNRVIKKDKTFYWYDIYIGKVESSPNIYFICFPYNKLKYYIANLFEDNSVEPNYHKPKVKEVLEKMESGYQSTDRSLTVQISKYTAKVKDEANASRVNIIGENPLNSKVYNLLKKHKVGLTTTSLKLRCSKVGAGHIEISFDRIGNYRFWIKRDSAETSLPLLTNAYSFFSDMGVLEIDSYMSFQTLLETDD